jgi:hypothetical protein
MIKTFRYRLYPSKPQVRLLERTLETWRCNAVRSGRLQSWDDLDEPTPQRRTQVRESQVRRRWPARRAQERG